MTTVLVFILLLGVLILVHELGHFWAARRLGVGVEEFAIGFPPRLWSKIKRGTRYSLNLIPFGGFVKLKGEDELVKEGEARPAATSSGLSLNQAARWRRAVLLVAGVFMNYLLGVVLLTIGFAVGLPQIIDNIHTSGVKDPAIQVAAVNADSPAGRAGLQLGDIIVNVDSRIFASLNELQNYVAERSQQSVVVKIKRGHQETAVNLTPQVLSSSNNRAVMGVGLIYVGRVATPWWQAPLLGWQAANNLVAAIITGLGEIIGKLFAGQGNQVDVAGPIGVAVLTGRAVAMGWIYVLQFMAVLSINLAVINLLPLPALDGGRLVLLAIESVRRRSLSQNLEALLHRFGFTALIGLLILISLADVRRFGTGMWQAIKNLFGI